MRNQTWSPMSEVYVKCLQSSSTVYCIVETLYVVMRLGIVYGVLYFGVTFAEPAFMTNPSVSRTFCSTNVQGPVCGLTWPLRRPSAEVLARGNLRLDHLRLVVMCIHNWLATNCCNITQSFLAGVYALHSPAAPLLSKGETYVLMTDRWT